jgi:murein peptide amidase A
VKVSERFDWPQFQADFPQVAAASGFVPAILTHTEAGEVIAWEKPGNGPLVYLSSGIHGDEPAGPLALLELMRSDTFGPEASWILCPALNPTGLLAGTRESASGQDLNRDYWTRRNPEVSAHAAWLETRAVPDVFISLHEDWETTGFYFYEINCCQDSPERASAILDAVAPWFQPEPCSCIDDHDVRDTGWIYHAAEADLPECWPEAIFLAKLGCPVSFTFETPSQALLSSRVAAHAAAVKAALLRVAGFHSPSS